MDINVNRYTIEDVLKVLIYPLFTSLAILAFFLFFFLLRESHNSTRSLYSLTILLLFYYVLTLLLLILSTIILLLRLSRIYTPLCFAFISSYVFEEFSKC